MSECKHGLLPESCSICLHGLSALQPGGWTQFTCRYRSRCEICGETIIPHTRVLYRDKIVRHLACGAADGLAMPP